MALCLREVRLPHGCDHALEAGMQHCSCEMNRLLRLLCVGLGRLARRQIRKPGLVKIQGHQLGHCQLSVAEMEATIEGVCLILSAMTREMDKVRGLDMRRDAFNRRMLCHDVDAAVTLARPGRVLHGCQLLLDKPQRRHHAFCKDAIFGDSEYVQTIGSSLRRLALCVQQRRQCRSV
jgi:hypothetical protein